MHFSDSQTTQLQLKSLRLWVWTPRHNALTIKRVIRQSLNDLIGIIRQNHRQSFSDPILSSGCSCVKRHLMWHPMSVSPAKKSGAFLVDDSVAKHYHRMVGWCWLYILPLFPCFSIFFMFSFMFSHFSHSSYRSRSWGPPCYDVFSPKGVQRYSWMNGLGKVKVRWEPKGCGGSTVFDFFPTGARWN